MINPMKWEQSPMEEEHDYLDTITSQEGGSIHESLYGADDWQEGVGGDTGEWVGEGNPFDTYEV